VITVLPVGWMSENDLLRAVSAVACGSGHPAAEELLREADVRVIRVVDAVNCERVGAGAVGVVAGSRVLMGSPEFLLEHEVELSPIVPMAVSDGMFLVAIDGRFAGMMLMDDA
jgi:cation transport ATPase